MENIEYHLEELKIAHDKNDENRILPDILDSDKTILDIGCGIGQALTALDCTDRICIGLDLDEDAVGYGVQNYGSRIHFVLSDAQQLPILSNSFNLVFSRVSLPYTNIPEVIKEIRRVLQSDGRVWMTLHSRDLALRFLKEAISSRNLKRVIWIIYVLINGYILKYFGTVFPFINGRFESWQDMSAMKRLLIRNGFEVSEHKVGMHTVIEGVLI